MWMARGLDGVVVALGLVPAAAAQTVFGPPVESVTGLQHFYSGAAGDLNGDGFADLAFTIGAGQAGRPYVYFGDGRGRFGPATATSPDIISGVLGLGDLDGDGLPELLTVPETDEALPRLDVWTGLGGNNFSGPASYPLAGLYLLQNSRITVGDFDGDADLDVLVRLAELPLTQTDWDAVTLLLNDGTGALVPIPVASGTQIPNAESGDLNGDGLADVVYTHIDWLLFGGPPEEIKTHVLLGQPGGGFLEVGGWPDAILSGLADLNLDGRLDVILEMSPLTVQLGQGDGTFVPQPGFSLPVGESVEALADFDGDHVPDLLFQHYTGVIYSTWAVWPGDGRGAFDETRAAYANRPSGVGGSLRFRFVADATGDARPDIIAEVFTDGYPYQISVDPNWTYPASAPQLDLGHPQFGVDGWPGTAVSGQFSPNQLVTVQLWNVGDDLLALLVAGLTESVAPFKGGVMVPEPDALFGPISTGSDPILELKGRWPGGLPVGATFTLQWWIADPIAPQGMSASTAVRITQP